MRHRIAGKKLNRDTKHRKALFKNLVAALLEHGEITTTEAKAKAIKGLVDKIIHKAQQGTVAARRTLAGFFGQRSLVNRVVDQVAPAMKDRVSGFTRIIKMGRRRGDNAMLVKMELVQKSQEEKKAEKSASKAVKTAKKTVAEAKKPEKAQKFEKAQAQVRAPKAEKAKVSVIAETRPGNIKQPQSGKK